MHPGGLTTQASGHTRNQIRFFEVVQAGPRAARVRFMPMAQYARRFYAIAINGVIRRPFIWCAPGQIIERVFPVDAGLREFSAYIEDCGLWADVPAASTPDGMARIFDGGTATRISFKWTPPSTFSQANYYVTANQGDTQVSAIVITGMQRGRNCEPVEGLPNRARLYYTITTTGGEHTVQWLMGDVPVAEGTRTGDGALTCTELDGSGLEIACTLTYTGDVAADVAWIDLIWPDSYQIHYTTDALAFPRTPEAIALDTGIGQYAFLSPSVADGTYNVAVVPVRENTPMSAGITTGSVTITSAPTAPASLAAAGNAEFGATVLSEDADDLSGWTLNQVTIVSDDITGPDGVLADKMLETADNAVHLIQSTEALGAGEHTFAAIVKGGLGRDWCRILVQEGVSFIIRAWFDMTNGVWGQVSNGTTLDPVGLGDGWWLIRIKGTLSGGAQDIFFGLSNADGGGIYLGDITKGLYCRRCWAEAASDVGYRTVLSWSLNGESGATYKTYYSKIGEPVNLGDFATPAPFGPSAVDQTAQMLAAVTGYPGFVRALVRATKSGIEETNGNELRIEYDSSGAIVAARPAKASIGQISIEGRKITVNAVISALEPNIAAATVELFVQSGAINFASAQDSGAVGDPVLGVQRATLEYTAAGDGAYNVAVRAKSAAGNQSWAWITRVLVLLTTAPTGGAENVIIEPLRGEK